MQTDRMSGMDGGQVSCARVITQVAQSDGLSQRAAVIAVTTAMAESTLHDYTTAVDLDSLGLFQQRPSQGWGTASQVTDPVYATNKFLSVMQAKYPNGSWQTGDIGAICQAVQVLALPDEYDKQVAAAQTVVNAVSAPSGYQVAFQAAGSSYLWTVGTFGNRDWQLGVKSGTSPSVAKLPTGGFQAAFQANTGDLWSAGSAGTKSWNLGMAAGTSPSIAALAGGGYEIAVQTNGGQLWTTSNTGATTNTQQGMAGATSPSIAALAGGGWRPRSRPTPAV